MFDPATVCCHSISSVPSMGGRGTSLANSSGNELSFRPSSAILHHLPAGVCDPEQRCEHEALHPSSDKLPSSTGIDDQRDCKDLLPVNAFGNVDVSAKCEPSAPHISDSKLPRNVSSVH